jgi:hypothetical protein
VLDFLHFDLRKSAHAIGGMIEQPIRIGHESSESPRYSRHRTLVKPRDQSRKIRCVLDFLEKQIKRRMRRNVETKRVGWRISLTRSAIAKTCSAQ